MVRCGQGAGVLSVEGWLRKDDFIFDFMVLSMSLPPTP